MVGKRLRLWLPQDPHGLRELGALDRFIAERLDDTNARQRLFDLVVSFFGLIVLFPFLLLIAVAIVVGIVLRMPRLARGARQFPAPIKFGLALAVVAGLDTVSACRATPPSPPARRSAVPVRHWRSQSLRSSRSRSQFPRSPRTSRT